MRHQIVNNSNLTRPGDISNRCNAIPADLLPLAAVADPWAEVLADLLTATPAHPWAAPSASPFTANPPAPIPADPFAAVLADPSTVISADPMATVSNDPFAVVSSVLGP